MPTFDALLRDVIDHPDDDTPRLILGDWLLDQPDAGNQARGEFIHTQVRLARMELDDPGRADLEMRQAQLLPEYPQKWARPYRRAGIRTWHFARGLVEGLTLRAEQFDHLKDRLISAQPIQHLRLIGRGWQHRLLAWEGLERLRFLDWEPGGEGSLLSSPRLAGLRHLTLSRYQRFAGTYLPAAELANWPFLPSLETLRLPRYFDSGLAEVLCHPERTPRLRSLSTSQIAGLQAALPRLHALHVRLLPIRNLVPLIHRATALRSLTLSACFMRQPDELSQLLRQTSLWELRSLAFHSMPIPEAAPLVELLARGNLLRLELPAFSADMPHLRSLSISNGSLSPATVRDILEAEWRQQLHTLVLRSCHLSPQAVASMVRLDWPKLGVLDVRGNEVPEAEKAMLRQKFGVRVRY